MAHYDDPQFSYTQYWQGREYEHLSEVLALNKLLQGLSFQKSADIGGGFGRLTPALAPRSPTTYLIEPSAKMRRLASKSLRSKNVEIMAGSAARTRLPDSSLDCAILVRVLHHIPNLQPIFSELTRILKPNGYLVIEFANSLNFKSRLKSFISGEPIFPTPTDLRSLASIRKKYISFVNHHPQTVLKTLRLCRFAPLRVLSVSNFRSPLLKKIVPLQMLLLLESASQTIFSKIYFGPSIFILAQKIAQ